MIMNLKEVIAQRKNAEENNVIYITGQRNTYPEGLYLVTAMLIEDELVFSEFNTGYQIDKPDGSQFELHGHNLHANGRNVETGEEFEDMQVTANDKIISELDKNPKATLLVKTSTRKRSRGDGTYQVLELKKIGKKKELTELANEMIGTVTV